MTIFVIGNSHTSLFKYDNRFICVEGNIKSGATAYNLNKENSTTQSRRILFELVNRIDKEKDTIILTGYGEVDCRIHIYYQFKKNNEKYSIEELIVNTVLNYGYVMEELKNMGINFYICGITPAGWEPNLNNYPWYTTPDIHSRIYNTFNNVLKLYCEVHGHKYLDIYSKTVDIDGHMKREYSEDKVHLKRNALPFVIDMLKSFGEKL